jgi:protein-S-isoprenylcysteine O-methyltransferase Ste14
VNAALVSAFALHHSLLARSGAKRALAGVLSPAAQRAAYVWTASLLLMAVCVLWRPLPGLIYDVPAPWRSLLYALQVGGLWLVWRGAAVVDVRELTGIRQAHGDTRPPALRIVGPFRIVRHPIYLGWMLLVLAAPMMTTGRLVFAVATSVYLVVAVPFEERSLVETFGDAYRRYRTDVRWRIVPGLW